MVLKRVIPTLTVSAACALGAVPVTSARAATDASQASSGNWSGYVAGGNSSESFTSVTGSWVQPTARCSASNGAAYSAFWVGLGGAGASQKLEQDGTEANCAANGAASYYAWYELVPNAPVRVDLPVHPGDQVTATTTTVAGDQTTFDIVNHTTGRSFSKQITFKDPDVSSAEWIAEAPSACQGSVSNCTALSLADFDKVTFSSASATDTSGHTGSISDSRWQTAALTLDPSESSTGFTSFAGGSGGGATAGSLSSDGSSFDVTCEDESPASSSTGGYGYGYGYGYGGGYVLVLSY